MGKILFGVLIVVIVWLLFFARRKFTIDQTANKNGNGNKPALKSERMVSCTRCGVNIPESEAAQDADGQFACRNASACGSAAK